MTTYRQENPDLFAEKTPKELALENRKRVLSENKAVIDRLFRGLETLERQVKPLYAKAEAKELDEIPNSPRFVKG